MRNFIMYILNERKLQLKPSKLESVTQILLVRKYKSQKFLLKIKSFSCNVQSITYLNFTIEFLYFNQQCFAF